MFAASLTPRDVALTVGSAESRPSHEGSVVVEAEAVPVLHDEQSLDGTSDLPGGGQRAVSKDVLVHPWIGGDGR